jgi:hypothetical protein
MKLINSAEEDLFRSGILPQRKIFCNQNVKVHNLHSQCPLQESTCLMMLQMNWSNKYTGYKFLQIQMHVRLPQLEPTQTLHIRQEEPS